MLVNYWTKFETLFWDNDEFVVVMKFLHYNIFTNVIYINVFKVISSHINFLYLNCIYFFMGENNDFFFNYLFVLIAAWWMFNGYY